MSADKSITIGMPVFNDISFIESSIQGILGQTYSDFHLIISDDGSTDGSADICQKYAAQDLRITYIRQEKNLGISRNMKFLLNQAQTKYFMWAADDDLWSSDFIEVLIDSLEKNRQAVSAFGTFSIIDESSNIIKSNINFDFGHKSLKKRLINFLKNSNDTFGYGIFVREKIKDIEFPIWWWPNNLSAYNNIYPTLYYYLCLGDYSHTYGKSLFFNRVKTDNKINHSLPFTEDSLLETFTFVLRRFNLVLFTFKLSLKQRTDLLTKIAVFPILFYYWFWIASLLKVKHYIKLMFIKKPDTPFAGIYITKESANMQICKRCVMDNINDLEISFDKNGLCNYCSDYFNYIEKQATKKEFTINTIVPIIEQIKKEGKNKKYDCIVGISGGTDSVFLVHKLVELGIRPLAVHYDNGWNSETAATNMEVLLKKLNVDLYTHVNDWEEFKDLQLSFLKAGVIDIELLTDQAIIALLYNLSEKYSTKYIFSGHNTATEYILPPTWYHWKLDALNILSIHKKFSNKPIRTYPLLSYLKQYWHNKYRRTKTIYLLNYLNYDKGESQKILAEKFGWKNYGAKHNESIFTRFYQNYILPIKFNVDKRKAHLSSLVCSGQISREKALEELKIRIWETAETKQDKEYVIKKLGITEEVFDNWMKEKPVSHFNYPSYLTRHDKIVRKIKKIIGRQ